jgi:hypothetical protein
MESRDFFEMIKSVQILEAPVWREVVRLAH